MGLIPEIPAITLLRRGLGRMGECGIVGSLLDVVGIFPTFSDLLAVPNYAFGFGLITVTASAIYDCIELSIRPGILATPCDSDEPELPLG